MNSTLINTVILKDIAEKLPEIESSTLRDSLLFVYPYFQNTFEPVLYFNYTAILERLAAEEDGLESALKEISMPPLEEYLKQFKAARAVINQMIELLKTEFPNTEESFIWFKGEPMLAPEPNTEETSN